MSPRLTAGDSLSYVSVLHHCMEQTSSTLVICISSNNVLNKYLFGFFDDNTGRTDFVYEKRYFVQGNICKK